MTFEEVDIDIRTTPSRTSSYTTLLDYCACDIWKDEARRFNKKRKSIEVCENTTVEKESLVHDIISDIWVDSDSDQPSHEEEMEDLQDAYKVMSKMAAEYFMMERAAAKFTNNQGYREGALPIMRSCDTKDNLTKISTSFLSEPNIVPVVYKENTALCREWLMEHYESKEGVSIPRSAMYSHYLDFCGEGYNDPLNPAGFGKAVRSVFLNVQTRRLGNRGASKYHYYGLSIKDTSPYKEILLGTQRVNHMLEGDPSSRYLSSFHPRTLNQTTDGLGVGVILEGFPSINCVLVPQHLKLQLKVFLSMYKTHCETVLDIVLRTNFTEIKETVTLFWGSLPEHLLNLLSHDIVVHIVHLCDVALYKSIGGMLLPNISQSQPQSLLASIRNLTENMVEWTQLATVKLPGRVKQAKLTAVRDFEKLMKRQSILNHIIQGAKATLRDHDIVKKMLSDWLGLDQLQITKEVLRTMGEEDDARSLYHVRKSLRDFERLLSHRVSLDKYFSFVSNILHHCTSTFLMKSNIGLEEAVSRFMLYWTSAINAILRELTIGSVQTFGSFHLLGMLFTDYLMYLVEERQRSLAEVKLKDAVYRGNKVPIAAFTKPTVPEYKNIAPKNISEQSTSFQKLTNSLKKPIQITMRDSTLSGIMSQLSGMNQLKTMENQHLYLATPIKLSQNSGSNNVAMNNIISQITSKILLESKVSKLQSAATAQNYCIKADNADATEKQTLCGIGKDGTKITSAEPFSSKTASSNIHSATDKTSINQAWHNSHPLIFQSQQNSNNPQNNVKSTSAFNKPKFLFLCPKPFSQNQNNAKDASKDSSSIAEHSAGHVIRKNDNIKIVSISSLKQASRKELPNNVAASKGLHLVAGNHRIDSALAYEALRNCLKTDGVESRCKDQPSVSVHTVKVNSVTEQSNNGHDSEVSMNETRPECQATVICKDQIKNCKSENPNLVSQIFRDNFPSLSTEENIFIDTSPGAKNNLSSVSNTSVVNLPTNCLNSSTDIVGNQDLVINSSMSISSFADMMESDLFSRNEQSMEDLQYFEDTDATFDNDLFDTDSDMYDVSGNSLWG